MIVGGAVLKCFKQLLWAFLIQPQEVRFEAFRDLRVSLVAAVIAELDGAATTRSRDRRKNGNVVRKPILLTKLQRMVDAFLDGQVLDAKRQRIVNHALLVFNAAVLVDVIGPHFSGWDGASRPNA